jgi:hypothetical protein
VTLEGEVKDDGMGGELVQRVRHVPGVVAVRDRLTRLPARPPGGGFDVLASFSPD